MARVFSNIWKKPERLKTFSFTSLEDIKSLLGRFSGFGNTSGTELVNNYTFIPDIYAITDYVTSQISKIPVKIVNEKGDDTNNKELSELIRQPNQYQNWNELIKLFFAYYEITGNAYLYSPKTIGIKGISELYVLPSQDVKILFARRKEEMPYNNSVSAYEVNKGRINAAEVLHKRNINLRYMNGDWAYGVSKYVPADKITEDLKAIYNARTSIIDKRGALGVLSNESEVPDFESTNELKAKLEESYGLGPGKRKFVITTQKLKWQQIALGVAELQLIENAKYDFEKLCHINGFDPVIFSTEGSTFANKKEARKDFIASVIVPKVSDFYIDLGEFMGKYFGGDMIVPDWSKVPELKEDEESLSKRMVEQIKVGVITPYFAHNKLYGITENMPEDKYVMTKILRDENALNG